MNKLLTIFVLLIASQSAVLGSLFSARLSSPMHLVAKADGVVDKEQSDADLKKGIAKFYDESSSIWIDVWGEDMHHGYYESTNTKDHKAAQVNMIDRSLEWAYGEGLDREKDRNVLEKKLRQMKAFVDVGCGVGGSSRHIARRYGRPGVRGSGISLSPYQIQRAQEFTAGANLTSSLDYRVADAMKMPFKDNSMDLVWSMESGEHMPDKKQFMRELCRVTAPGGRILVVTWCHRELKDGEKSLTAPELRLLDKINKAYYLPDWVPGSQYVELAKSLGLKDVKTVDWSAHVAPFWPAVMRSALRPRNLLRMLRSSLTTGPTTIRGAVASWWMLRGFQKGLVKFVLITGRK